VAHEDGQSPAAEAYRDLRTSLLLSNPGSPPRRLMVTSALPEEGKTATSINVATVLAQLGRRVALVDTDLRRPRLHRAFGRTNDTGISTYLSGLADDVAALVVPTAVDNLDLVPSGPIPPNPAEMLDSPRFAQFVDALLGQGYEHIVFDSPPILSVADPVIIAQSVDSGILAVRAGRTPRQSVRLAAQRLDKTRTGRFGVVLNDLDPELHDAGHYRYRYYGQPERRSKRRERAGGSGA
jgi:capsular exopolysaccharide synthesis family protein